MILNLYEITHLFLHVFVNNCFNWNSAIFNFLFFSHLLSIYYIVYIYIIFLNAVPIFKMIEQFLFLIDIKKMIFIFIKTIEYNFKTIYKLFKWIKLLVCQSRKIAQKTSKYAIIWKIKFHIILNRWKVSFRKNICLFPSI